MRIMDALRSILREFLYFLSATATLLRLLGLD